MDNGSTPVCCDEAYVVGSKTQFQDVCVAASSQCMAGDNATLPDGGDAGPITSATSYSCNKPADCAAKSTEKYCYLVPSTTFDGGAFAAGLCGKVPTGASAGTICGSDSATLHAKDIQLCTTSADCLDTTKTCTAIVSDGNPFGGCL